MLASMSDLLTKGQIGDFGRAHKVGEDMFFKITQEQVGSGIGSLIASIGIPLIVDALRGKRVTQSPRRGIGVGIGRGAPRIGGTRTTGEGGVRIGGTRQGKGAPRMGMPLMVPPPFLGTWTTTGRGKKN